MEVMTTDPHHHDPPDDEGDPFSSPVVDRIREAGNVWELPAGRIRLPEVFGFCRGVKRALTMLQQAVAEYARQGQNGAGRKKLLLLGQIIHNPWVNSYFENLGVRILSRRQIEDPARHITADDCAVIPAFGVKLPVERQLAAIGCRIVDTSCGDVRRLWSWADRASADGYGVLIFGRADHDETVVTKSRLEASGGRYVVVGNLDHTRGFCELIARRREPGEFAGLFGPAATNSPDLQPFHRLAQVSQTTMLYDETLAVRQLIRQAFVERFGPGQADARLLFQPTVCRATQARQTAAVKLCRQGCDLVVVVGGFDSSNTRHLYELARGLAPAWFIETADAIHGPHEIETFDPAVGPRTVTDWLPTRRPLTIGVLAGASSPEIVVGLVLQRLATFLG
jgi:4-hydroxy-3-methylbut-2-enyl diphosphate reductase